MDLDKPRQLEEHLYSRNQKRVELMNQDIEFDDYCSDDDLLGS